MNEDRNICRTGDSTQCKRKKENKQKKRSTQEHMNAVNSRNSYQKGETHERNDLIDKGLKGRKKLFHLQGGIRCHRLKGRNKYLKRYTYRQCIPTLYTN